MKYIINENIYHALSLVNEALIDDLDPDVQEFIRNKYKTNAKKILAANHLPARMEIPEFKIELEIDPVKINYFTQRGDTSGKQNLTIVGKNFFQDTNIFFLYQKLIINIMNIIEPSELNKYVSKIYNIYNNITKDGDKMIPFQLLKADKEGGLPIFELIPDTTGSYLKFKNVSYQTLSKFLGKIGKTILNLKEVLIKFVNNYTPPSETISALSKRVAIQSVSRLKDEILPDLNGEDFLKPITNKYLDRYYKYGIPYNDLSMVATLYTDNNITAAKYFIEEMGGESGIVKQSVTLELTDNPNWKMKMGRSPFYNSCMDYLNSGSPSNLDKLLSNVFDENSCVAILYNENKEIMARTMVRYIMYPAVGVNPLLFIDSYYGLTAIHDFFIETLKSEISKRTNLEITDDFKAVKKYIFDIKKMVMRIGVDLKFQPPHLDLLNY